MVGAGHVSRLLSVALWSGAVAPRAGVWAESTRRCVSQSLLFCECGGHACGSELRGLRNGPEERPPRDPPVGRRERSPLVTAREAASPRKTISCDICFPVPPRSLHPLAALGAVLMTRTLVCCPCKAGLGRPRGRGSQLHVQGLVGVGYKLSVSQVNAREPCVRETSVPRGSGISGGAGRFPELQFLVWKRWEMRPSQRQREEEMRSGRSPAHTCFQKYHVPPSSALDAIPEAIP